MSYSSSYSQLHYGPNAAVLSNRHFLSPPWVGYKAPPVLPIDGHRFGVNPNEWGPNAWEFLFSVARGYPESPGVRDRHQMRLFLRSLRYALPCKDCRYNFKNEVLKLSDDDLQSSTHLYEWLSQLRDKIKEKKQTKDEDFEVKVEEDAEECPQICTSCSGK